MKRLITGSVAFLFYCFSAIPARADVFFDDVNMMLYIPATAPELQIIIDYHNDNVSEPNLIISRLFAFTSSQARQYYNKATTDRQRAELVLEKIKLRRQFGPLIMHRIPSDLKTNRFPYEYVIVQHDPKLHKWMTTLNYGDIDLQLQYLAQMLGARVAADTIVSTP